MVKIAPPSADMLIKLAVLGVGVGVAVYAVRRVTGAVSDAAGQAWGALERGAQWVMDGTRYINPASPDNLIYSGMNANQWPDGSNTWGSWLYDEIHFENHPEYEFMGPPNPYESGNNGNYTSVMPPVTGTGGAAFGMYPRANTGGASGSW